MVNETGLAYLTDFGTIKVNDWLFVNSSIVLLKYERQNRAV